MEAQSQLQPTVAATAARYGLFTGIVNILYSFGLLATNQVGNAALGWISLLIIPVVGIVLAQRDFRVKNAGFMSYGEGVGIGALLSLLNGLLSSVFSYVYREFIDPDVVRQVTEQMRNKLEQAGTMSDAQIDQAIAMSQKFSTGLIGFVIGLVSVTVVGTVLSLIISAFLKNAKPEFE
ncbi:MAG: DUF4199 domain-containing protein [Hymenobacter sp.]|nr:MAG: DUF4199 domain-containing protein [Hymenobacter sp.]